MNYSHNELPQGEERGKKRDDISSHIFGWILLILGVAVIGWTLMSSYNIFTGQSALPEFFESPGETLSPKETGNEVQDQLQQMIGEQLQGLLPANSIPQFFNLIVWSMLAFILIFGGSQISGLGIKLIKGR